MALEPIQRPVYATNTRPPRRGARKAVEGETFDHVMQATEQEEAGSKQRELPQQASSESMTEDSEKDDAEKDESEKGESSGEGHIDERI